MKEKDYSGPCEKAKKRRKKVKEEEKKPLSDTTRH